ncbi:Crp/Fnr family transcriptional regulator [Leadbettera azotonutricia]|uniref:Cyclic nucleotide-binding protein n=1 Tax=Leadbettera azotonutricia (strain ATCC BAA-888 / DSM 13862 / ZAS-9) TaxID=545695 RepID=F5YA67_LEAAZ|nr:cyclic nucleotide-binding domain-containing protein [Leadbettera azotonutricia]AEF82296.1 cyclic nucleotide-binding protein [Leadbettera azotonutricia ZAS-9]
MAGQLQLIFVNFKKGSYIVVEGKLNADRFFIIRQGKVRVSKEVEVVEEEGGNVLGPGDFFGVVSTMSSHSHIETAQALTDVTLISVQKEQYGQLIQNNTPVAMKIILQFSKRLRYLDAALSRLTLKNASDAEANPSHLFNVGEYYAKQSQYNQAYYAYHQYIKYCPKGDHVMASREKMMKIAPFAKSVRIEFKADEFNRAYPKGSMLFSEGEPGEELYIIQRGSVKIVKIMDAKEVLLAVLKAGDIFGEMALLEAKPRAASAVAYEDCMVLAVNRANFERMIGTQPQIIARLTTLLSERIWFIYKQLANTQINDPIGRMYDALLIQLEKNRAPLHTANDYTFDFGPTELTNMVGIPQADANFVLRKLLENKKFRLVNNKLQALDISEIAKQTEYYRKMQRIEKTRREGGVR